MGSDLDQRIGENVVTLRGEMSQKALAEAMRARGHKWSQATVWSVEKGDRPLKLAEAKDLADELAADVYRLIQAPQEVTLGRILQRRFVRLDVAQDALIDAAREYENARRDLDWWVRDGLAKGYEDESWPYQKYADVTVAEVVEPVLAEVEADFAERMAGWFAEGGPGRGVDPEA